MLSKCLKIPAILYLTKTIKNEPKFTGCKKSGKESKKCNWEYDVKLLMAGDNLQKETQMDWKSKCQCNRKENMERNQKIKVELFSCRENIKEKKSMLLPVNYITDWCPTATLSHFLPIF